MFLANELLAVLVLSALVLVVAVVALVGSLVLALLGPFAAVLETSKSRISDDEGRDGGRESLTPEAHFR